MHSLSTIKKTNDAQVKKELSRKPAPKPSPDDDKCYFYAGKWRTLKDFEKQISNQ